ncbi:hypothetical protein F511_30038 [Dorcoceras hygrometricum]|uniref:Uncharacterized protein n=1 Tax=Dorcoceras hygrometricum TaxID=472368 RepID=A0A2Z7CXX7_9LAMI|nr:hypothetical protein F511_30038 [Dorcoceras hygrometricum]
MLDLPAPATMARALPTGPPSGLGGSNVTNLASNRGLTKEKQSLQVDAPAMLRTVTTTCWYQGSFSLLRPPLPEPFRMDHPQVQKFPTRPTLAPNEHARRRTTHTKWAHGAALEHAARGVPLLANGSSDFSHIWATPSLPQDPLEQPNNEPRSLRQPLNRSHARTFENREMQSVRIHEHDHMHKDLKHPRKSQ